MTVSRSVASASASGQIRPPRPGSSSTRYTFCSAASGIIEGVWIVLAITKLHATDTLPNCGSSRPAVISSAFGARHALELQRRPQAEDQRVTQEMPGLVGERVGCPAAGMQDVLKVGLERPARPDTVLIDRREQALETSLNEKTDQHR